MRWILVVSFVLWSVPAWAETPSLPEVPDVTLSPTQFDQDSGAPLATPEDAVGQRRRRNTGRRRTKARRRRGKRRPRRPTAITVPVQVGFGPTANFITGPIQDDQLVHYGLRWNATAVIGRKLIRQNLNRVPRQYRRLAKGMTELRYKPMVAGLIPNELIISPKLANTGMYGLGWKLLGAGLVFSPSPVRFSLDGGLLLKYLYIDSNTLGVTHFIRPGVELRAALELELGGVSWLEIGWASQLYVPQRLGGSPLEIQPFEESVWHIGQAFVLLHFRFPYTVVM